jgi:hypothetical protein
MSLDGFVAGANDEVDEVFSWIRAGDVTVESENPDLERVAPGLCLRLPPLGAGPPPAPFTPLLLHAPPVPVLARRSRRCQRPPATARAPVGPRALFPGDPRLDDPPQPDTHAASVRSPTPSPSSSSGANTGTDC